MKIYTRNGDDGLTSLTGKTRVPKYHPRIEACGSIDELIAWIGHLLDFRENEGRKEMLLHIQDQLMRCAYLVASEDTIREEVMPDPCFLQKIENEIDRMEADLPSLRNFILPGGHAAISGCHIARCVCRRAERSVVKLNFMEAIPEIVLKLLNRLADYLFVLARRLGSDLDIQCVEWKV